MKIKVLSWNIHKGFGIDGRYDLERISEVLERAGSSPTFPAGRPSARIDYVLASSDCAIIESGTVQTDASDHLPVYAIVEIGGSSAVRETEEEKSG
ncbi:MAG: endonuclease/exonuclease/phosphatase family protein [Candidatus Aquicultorales bacterium]